MITAIWVTFKVLVVITAAGLLFAWLAKPADAKWIKARALPMMGGLFAAGMFAPSVWVIYILIAAVIPMLARSRAEAAALYIITMLALPQLATETAVAGLYLLSFDKWLFGAIGVTIAFLILPARGPRPSRWFDVPFILIMILELAQARGTNFTSFLRAETVVVLCYILPYFIISRCLRRPEDVRLFLTAICFGAFVLAIVALYEARTYFLVYDTISQRLGIASTISSYSHQRSGMLRANGSFPEATSFGIFLAQALISALALRDLFRSKRLWLVALGCIFLGIYAANARSALLAAGLGLVGYDLYRRRYLSLAVKFGAFAMLYSIALLIAQFSTNFAERIGYGDAASTTGYRQLLLQRGIEEIMKHPFVGVDPSTAVASLSDLRQGEGIIDFVNGYVYYGLTTGIPGVLALLGAFVLMAWKAWANRKRLRDDVRMLQAGGVVFAIALESMLSCLTSGFGGRAEIIFYLFVGIGSTLSGMRLASREEGATKVARPAASPALRTMSSAG